MSKVEKGRQTYIQGTQKGEKKRKNKKKCTGY